MNFEVLSCRCLCGTWIMFSLVLSSSYSGILRSFFFNPSFTQPIDSLEDLVNGGIPWEMVEYGEGIEGFLANSDHPTLKKFWQNRLPGTFGLNETKVSSCKLDELPNYLLIDENGLQW